MLKGGTIAYIEKIVGKALPNAFKIVEKEQGLTEVIMAQLEHTNMLSAAGVAPCHRSRKVV